MAENGPTSELLTAVDEGDLLAVEKLLKTPGVCVNTINKHGESPLHIAAGYGQLDIVKHLQENGASLDLKDKQGDSPLYWAARHGHLEVVQYLCEQGAPVNTRDTAGETPAHVSARYGHPHVLSYLCQAGADLDIKDKDGETPLLCGCWHGYQRVVERLVAAGCSLTSANNDQECALHMAAVRGYHDIVRLLCENGASLDQLNKDGRSALHLSAKRNHTNIVQYLCEKGCNVNMQDHNGDTALHEVSREGQLETFHVLHNAICNLNARNKNGATPLHLAAKYGHAELARQLCLVGADINVATEHGFHADEVAANYNHDKLASLLHQLKQVGVLEHCRRELTVGKSPPSRVKLLVCGASGVGKTELIDSLKCGRIKSLFRKRSVTDLRHTLLKRTYGMSVQSLSLPHAGEFSVWDFSGLDEYHVTHEYFLDARNAVFLLVFDLRDPPHKQAAQVRHWLAVIKSKRAPARVISYAGRNTHRPHVVIVGSFLDQQQPSISDDNSISSAPSVSPASLLLDKVVDEFGDYFQFDDRVYCLDCRLAQSSEVRQLRGKLASLRQAISRAQPCAPPLVGILTELLPLWRREHGHCPVLSWEVFLDKTRATANPLVTVEVLRAVATALHDVGEIVCFSEDKFSNVVVLDPNWLGLQIFASLLSPENSVIPQLKSVTGRVSLAQLQQVFTSWDLTSIANLLEYFQLSAPLDDDRSTFLVPALIKMEPLFGLWEKDLIFSVYAGVNLTCKSAVDVFSPGLFARIQLHCHKMFSDDIREQELILWSNGLKYCKGKVEIYLSLNEPPLKNIQLLVRGSEETRTECFCLLNQFYSTVVEMIRSVNPGTQFSTHILSVSQLKDHSKFPGSYSSIDVYQAERAGHTLTHPSLPDLRESIVDLVCCGSEDLLISVKSAPYALLRDLPLLTRTELCRMLDVPERFGRDWCLLALQLGMIEQVPRIHQASDGRSPTDKLLEAWDQGSCGSLVTIVDALQALGRDDAAQVLIGGLSPFSNADNSVVVNLQDVPVSAYTC